MKCKLDKKTKIGLWMCRTPALIFSVLEARGCYLHLKEGWPEHANFHSLTGTVLLYRNGNIFYDDNRKTIY